MQLGILSDVTLALLLVVMDCYVFWRTCFALILKIGCCACRPLGQARAVATCVATRSGVFTDLAAADGISSTGKVAWRTQRSATLPGI
ncbi:hypothetical protein AYM40_23335 [Paraburkholderia phytofirmans OLGA172]|uniref:Uncharacterized protein n=1 Tax=Paraburkholderia phytofirmans OLGA172 TaxID=1417228 RepID=A0A167WAK6_9BURK|nr:hypothetical protein AYM40_23335 [Paraburkholderia phytofirmans OLGA172]